MFKVFFIVLGLFSSFFLNFLYAENGADFLSNYFNLEFIRWEKKKT